jgi:hypothetical protein
VGVGGASARARMASALGVMASIRWERHPSDTKTRNLWRVGNSRSVGIAGTWEVGIARALGEEKNRHA